MSLLTQQLRSSASSSSLAHHHGNTHSLSSNLLSGSVGDDLGDLGEFNEHDMDPQGSTPLGSVLLEQEGDGELLFSPDETLLEESLGNVLSASSNVAGAHSRPIQSPFAKPPINRDSSSFCVGSMAIPTQQGQRGSSFSYVPMARSCPKPIVMPRRSRQGSYQHDQDDLSVFVPPHEMVATSLIDSSNVAESLSRKGSAALRVRTGVLRRTGFYEGHTETLRANGSSFKT